MFMNESHFPGKRSGFLKFKLQKNCSYLNRVCTQTATNSLFTFGKGSCQRFSDMILSIICWCRLKLCMFLFFFLRLGEGGVTSFQEEIILKRQHFEMFYFRPTFSFICLTQSIPRLREC